MRLDRALLLSLALRLPSTAHPRAGTAAAKQQSVSNAELAYRMY